MKYIKQYKIFEMECWIGSNYGGSSSLFEKKFGFQTDLIYDILVDVKDEFPDVDIWIDDAECSWIVEPDNENIFVIYFERTITSESPLRSQDYWKSVNREPLYDLEIFLNKNRIIETLNSHLKEYGLICYASDFGQSDIDYEIIVHRISNYGWVEGKYDAKVKQTPEYKRRYNR